MFSEHFYSFGPFRLSSRERILRRNREIVQLEPKALDTLLALVKRKGEFATKDDLRKEVWDGVAYMDDNSIERQIANLRKVLEKDQTKYTYIQTVSKRGYRFAALVEEGDTETRSSPPHRAGKIDYSGFIQLKTRDFAGRDWILDGIRRFIDWETCAYVVIKADPGVGKTAFVASLVSKHDYVHHFNDVSLGIVTIEQFVRNVSAQLIERYCPNYAEPTPEQCKDGAYLQKLLYVIADAERKKKQKIVILVDALDEAELPISVAGNVLALPQELPPGIFFVLTMRYKDASFPLCILTTRKDIPVDARSPENLRDIQSYLTMKSSLPSIVESFTAAGLTASEFVQLLTQKSEGNFMYLSHILPAIERGEYPESRFKTLPQGLTGYYDRHWRQMRGRDPDRWTSRLLPVVAVLAVVREPVSAAEIARFVQQDFPHFARMTSVEISEIINQWREFLVETVIGGVRCYRIYHSTFREFLEERA